MVVIDINTDADFAVEMAKTDGKVAVVDFWASWCGPCRNIAPAFLQMSNNYPTVVFMKVNVDKCQGTAAANGVSAMPTFLFFVSKNKVDTLKGADPQALQSKVDQWSRMAGGADEEGDDVAPGQMNLMTQLEKPKMECLNEDDAFSLRNFLENKESSLKSDADAQLIINLPFLQPMRVHSLVVKAPTVNGPKQVKIFINQPRTLDFDDAEASDAKYSIVLTAAQLAGEPISLPHVKFNNIFNMQLFVVDNQDDSDVTEIQELRVYGKPITATNMTDFKRVAGKPGEQHS